MALSVYQNLYAFTSQTNLARNQSALGKSIERLSSGLRINHAADDASGMAISEKMRGQISGMKRASMNAQDGISYLQTAEGAMEQASSILQRMRELAVQASNGIYTSNDRQEIQKEVDQLKEEINRISTSTEFNTRKLTNGEGIGLWSSSSNLVSAIVRGNVPEGNYEITMSVVPGKNQIQKSHIMTLNKDALGAEITSATGTNVASVSDPLKMSPTLSADITVTIANSASATSAVTTVGTYAASDSSWIMSAASTNTLTKSGYLEFEFTESTDGTGTTAARFRFIDAKTGEISGWEDVVGGVNAAGTTTTITSGVFGEFSIELNASTTKINKGDKQLFALTADPTSVAGLTAPGVLSSGGGIVQMGNGPSITYGEGELTVADNGDGNVDTKAVNITYVDLDSTTGNLNVGSINLNFREGTPTAAGSATGQTVAGSLTIAVRGGGEAATSTTKLKDIASFTNADGNMVLSPKKELTIYGNGTSTVIHLEGNDTIATLVAKLRTALVDDLGMGTNDPQVNKNLVQYVTVPNTTNNAWDSVQGTLLIQSAVAGSQGDLAFIGDQGLLNALGLAVVQESVNSATTVTVRDAHTGNFIGTETTGNDRIYSILDGVELDIDSRAGVDVRWNTAGGRNEILFQTNAALTNKKFYLHIVDNRTSLQIGANKGQDLNVSIPQLDLKGLGLDNMTMVTQGLAQKAIGEIDNALTMVVSARATVGAQISRLEYTINNLATARENLTTSESRIRDLDVAEESTTFAKYQVLVQSGVAMLAQANQIPSYALQLIQGR